MPWVLSHGKHRPTALFLTLGGPDNSRTAESGKAIMISPVPSTHVDGKDLSPAGLKSVNMADLSWMFSI